MYNFRCTVSHRKPGGRHGTSPVLKDGSRRRIDWFNEIARTARQPEQTSNASGTIPKRKLGKTGEQLSIIGFVGIVLMDNSPSFAANLSSLHANPCQLLSDKNCHLSPMPDPSASPAPTE
jgi:hypothetical protein